MGGSNGKDPNKKVNPEELFNAFRAAAKKSGLHEVTGDELKALESTLEDRRKDIEDRAMLAIAKNPYTGEYQWRPEMREISGFGNGYEETCRRMIQRGLEWFDKNSEADPRFVGYENIHGLTGTTNKDAEKLQKVCIKAAEEILSGPSGMQLQAAIEHIFWARKVGWEQYCKEMSKSEDKDDISK